VIAGAQPGACSPSYTAASGPGPTSGGVSDSDRRSGRLTVDHRLAARLLRLSPGRRRVTPIAGDRQLTVSRPAGRAVIADVIRAGGARAWCRGDPVRRRLPVYSPPASGRAAAALLGREEARGLTGPWMSLLHAGPPAASPRPYCARACGRAEPGPVGRSSTTPLCPGPPPGRTRPSRPFRFAPTVPGLAANPISAQSASPPRSHCARAHGRDGPGSGRTPLRPAGGPRPGVTSDGAATPADGRTQFGRCGVLTRILVGAAAAAGPGRIYAAAVLAGPDPTHRHSTPRRPVGRALAPPRPQVLDVPTRPRILRARTGNVAVGPNPHYGPRSVVRLDVDCPCIISSRHPPVAPCKARDIYTPLVHL
jgi:hypothetical protein